MDNWLPQHRILLLANLLGVALAIGVYFFVLQPQRDEISTLRTGIADSKDTLDKGQWPADKEQLDGNLRMLQEEYSRKSEDFAKMGKKQKSEMLMGGYAHLLTERIRREGYLPAAAAKPAAGTAKPGRAAPGAKEEAGPSSQGIAAFFIKEANKDQYMFEGKFQEFYNTYTNNSGQSLRNRLYPNMPAKDAGEAFSSNTNGYIWIGSVKNEIEGRFGISSLSKGSEAQPTYQLFLRLWAVDEAFKMAIQSGLLVARDKDGNSCARVLPIRGYAINPGADAKPYLLEVPVRVKFQGSVPQFCEFLELVGRKESFMPVASLEATVDPQNRSLWNFDVELVAFFPLEGGDIKSQAATASAPPGA